MIEAMTVVPRSFSTIRARFSKNTSPFQPMDAIHFGENLHDTYVQDAGLHCMEWGICFRFACP